MRRLVSRASALGVALALICVFTSAGAALAQSGTTSTAPDESFGFRGFGARLGLVDPEGASSTITYGLHANLGEFIPNLRITPLVEYWSVGVGSSDVSDFTVATNLDWAFPLVGPKVTPYAGGGVGIHWLRADNPAPAGDSKNTKLGLHVQGGIRDQVMPNLSLFGELRFTFVENADNWKLLGGFTYNFIY